MIEDPVSNQIIHQLLRDTAEQERELQQIRDRLAEQQLSLNQIMEVLDSWRSDQK